MFRSTATTGTRRPDGIGHVGEAEDYSIPAKAWPRWPGRWGLLIIQYITEQIPGVCAGGRDAIG